MNRSEDEGGSLHKIGSLVVSYYLIKNNIGGHEGDGGEKVGMKRIQLSI